MQPLNTKRINLILEEVTQWASQRNDIAAVALVGSWARGAARVDSDIDLMLLVTNPVSFRQDEKWIDEIHWSAVNAEVDNWKDKDYGMIWSRHVYLDDATEIEFGVGLRSWASVNPIDSSGNLEPLHSLDFRESAGPPHSTKEWGFEPILLI